MFYTQTGQIDFARGEFSTVSLRRSHGTHVTALAAGHHIDKAPKNRPIIYAVLPPRVVEQTSGPNLEPSIALEMHKLNKQALRFKVSEEEYAPVVFNFSYGSFGGPHDGTGSIARIFEQYLVHPQKYNRHTRHCETANQKRWLTLPAGNNFLDQMHAVLRFPNPRKKTDRTKSLTFLVLQDDRTSSHVEMWMPYRPGDEKADFVRVRIIDPFGDTSQWITAKKYECVELCNDDGEEIARLSYEFRGCMTDRGLIVLNLKPTAALDPDIPLAPAGRWEIEIEALDIRPDESVEIWVHRDQSLPGYRPGGRQAYFVSPDTSGLGRIEGSQRPCPDTGENPISNTGTLRGYACGRSPIVVAAYTAREKELSNYSAAGPITHRSVPPQDGRNGPDLTARGDDTWIQHGVLSARSRSGSQVRIKGC